MYTFIGLGHFAYINMDSELYARKKITSKTKTQLDINMDIQYFQQTTRLH